MICCGKLLDDGIKKKGIVPELPLLRKILRHLDPNHKSMSLPDYSQSAHVARFGGSTSRTLPWYGRYVRDERGRLLGICLSNADCSETDVRAVERAICIMEGLAYSETEDAAAATVATPKGARAKQKALADLEASHSQEGACDDPHSAEESGQRR